MGQQRQLVTYDNENMLASSAPVQSKSDSEILTLAKEGRMVAFQTDKIPFQINFADFSAQMTNISMAIRHFQGNDWTVFIHPQTAGDKDVPRTIDSNQGMNGTYFCVIVCTSLNLVESMIVKCVAELKKKAEESAVGRYNE